MAKGPIVTKEVEARIASVYQKHPKWKAPQVRSEVNFLLRKNNPELQYSWPSLSTVQKVLATVRRRMKELPVAPQDKPWSIATLDQYPILPEALPTVLKVWKSRIEKGEGFTIREAKWMARLSRLITDIETLSAKTSQYARTELIYELIGQSFDSTYLDRLLMGLPVTLTTPRSLLPFLAEQEDGLAQIRELVKGKSKKLHLHRTGTAGTVEILEPQIGPRGVIESHNRENDNLKKGGKVK